VEQLASTKTAMVQTVKHRDVPPLAREPPFSLTMEKGIPTRVASVRRKYPRRLPFDRMDIERYRHWIQRSVARSVVVIVGVGLFASACGASNPSAVDFSKQANGICQSYSANLRSVTAKLVLPKNESKKQLESELSNAVSLVQRGTNQLEALARPSSESSALNKAFRAQNAQIEDLQHLLAGFNENNPTKIQRAEVALAESEAPLNQQFDVLGMSVCGSGVAPPANGSK
jgi:hypothetical protein